MPITLRQPDIEAEISFIATDAGGRESAARSGYRACHDFGIKGILNDAAHEYSNSTGIEPGCKGLAKMWFLSPESQEGHLCPGFKFTVQEGSRVVGHGIVVKVINKSLQIRNFSQTSHIERATLAAVSPQAVEELPGWLLPFDTSTVGRAISAVPLSHTFDQDAASLVSQIEARYVAHGLQAAFRLPEVASFEPLRRHLAQVGYHLEQPTLVQVGSAAAMRQMTTQALAEVADTPDAAWAGLFLGEGFDPVDGAHRVRHLSSSQGTVFASVRESGERALETIAAGAGAFSHGWASVHGMRTAQNQRGKGLAGRVLASLAQVALDRGFENVFLQVEEANTSAVALYHRAGFVTAWRYGYWRKAG